MKNIVPVILAVVLIAPLFSLTVLAQEEKKQKNQLFAVFDDVVPPSSVGEFEAGLMAWKKLNTKYNFPVPVTVYKTHDNHYYSMLPIQDLADLDKLEEFWVEAKKKAGKAFEEDMAEVHKFFSGSYESETFGVITLRVDLSYAPENPRVKQEEFDFLWWNYYYVKTGMVKEAEEIAKEWQTLYKNNSIAESYNVFQPMMWSDLPAFVAAGGALSQADYFTNFEKTAAKFGDAYLALSKKTMDTCRRYEQKFGMIKRELSYVPEKK